MKSVFVIITKLIASKNYFCKEVFCNNFGRDGISRIFHAFLNASSFSFIFSLLKVPPIGRIHWNRARMTRSLSTIPIAGKTLSEWTGHSQSSRKVPGYSRSSSRNSEADAKFHSRNGISRLEQCENHNSRSNSWSDSRNSWAPTWKILHLPLYSQSVFSRTGVVPARKRKDDQGTFCWWLRKKTSCDPDAGMARLWHDMPAYHRKVRQSTRRQPCRQSPCKSPWLLQRVLWHDLSERDKSANPLKAPSFSRPEKEVITKGVFSLEESLESLSFKIL